MTRVGPGSTLQISARITYVLGGRDTSQDFEANALTYGSPALPELVWAALAGKRVGEQVTLEPREPFSLGGFAEHEVFEVPRTSFANEPRVGDAVQVPQDGGATKTMSVVSVEGERVLVSPNPLALNPVKRAQLTIVEVSGGLIIDGDQIDPKSVVRVQALELDGGDGVLRLSRVGHGNLHAGGGVVVNDGTDGGPARGLWIWHPTDSNHVIYSASPAGKSPADRQCTAGNFDGGHRFRLRTYADGQGFLFENSDEQALVDIDSRNGRLWAKGGLYSGNSDLYFTKTDHNHTGIGNAVGSAAIENAADYGALMILGRSVGDPMRRIVKVWDVMSVEGEFSAQRMLNNSDARDKHSVEDLDRGLAELERLRPVSFEWNGAQPGTRTYGLLAQEVREVLGDVVDVGKDDDAKLKVSYVELIPVLINAVKQLSAKVASLEAQLAAR